MLTPVAFGFLSDLVEVRLWQVMLLKPWACRAICGSVVLTGKQIRPSDANLMN